VGLDTSLTGTGVAHAWFEGFRPHAATWLLSSPAPPTAVAAEVAVRADRLVDLAALIVARVVACEPELVCVERPAYSSTSGSTTDRAGLWWLVLARLHRGLHVPIVDVVNNHLKMYAVGSGRASKDQVLAATVRRYGALVPVLADNNEADALQLAALGAHRLAGHPLIELPQSHHRALAAVKWPAHVPAGTN
jgi:crossover junction endodeoxyribonuclease RuvC